ncbi:MAG: FMN-binding protein [Lachnospiraceae bacterium]|nr:FMN-binding protein [Lachnospiraceae bacterium]
MSEDTAKKQNTATSPEKPGSKGGLIHDAVILFIITVIAALALGFVYELTKDPIAQAQAQAKADAFKAVFPSMESIKELDDIDGILDRANKLIEGEKAYEGVTIDDIVAVEGNFGLPLGWVMTVTSSKGYGGKITMTMGISNGNNEDSSNAEKGMLMGLEFLSISETPGLGMNAKEDAFKSQFRGANVKQFSLAKRNISGDTEIDAISSATITTTAVTRSVNAALKVAWDLFLNSWNAENGN